MDYFKKIHILKSISWRILGSIITFIIAWFSSGELKIGLSISVFDFIFKLILYYAHERLWHKVTNK
jgi:uncharacterized membrane protein